ncbi:type I-E CRISPR-associated protein Cse2/CasB [Saccharopolyspora elongata]|uniref:Type I-E CRISPR-associated protein Cse2/CasB n=1 Tax=Saccharopolyspora elongata TaxID=2530387 RepID=A0A4R4YWS6_9PSEU|nr:type I-E CRISPR-associated protein Cse2/CasB [Saccharopolyspora elongata]TDD49004.1 type I-E CRISPR-associated protein Cse2/CasB [Saccharopolyspora elongata]
MTNTTPKRYWSQRVNPDGTWRSDPRTKLPLQPPGEDLAAMRSGLGRPAGSVPALWPFYTCPVDEQAALRGDVSVEQAAEHAALALFGLHQQAQSIPMHRPKINLGKALKVLRGKEEKVSPVALDARVAAAATATSVPALLYRLRGLIEQLRTVRQPVDYDQLMNDIRDWHYSDARLRARSRWGLGYYAWKPATPGDEESGSSQD